MIQIICTYSTFCNTYQKGLHLHCKVGCICVPVCFCLHALMYLTQILTLQELSFSLQHCPMQRWVLWPQKHDTGLHEGCWCEALAAYVSKRYLHWGYLNCLLIWVPCVLEQFKEKDELHILPMHLWLDQCGEWKNCSVGGGLQLHYSVSRPSHDSLLSENSNRSVSETNALPRCNPPCLSCGLCHVRLSHKTCLYVPSS